MIADPIAFEDDFTLQRGDGPQTPLGIRIGRPFQADRAWSCAIEITYLQPETMIHGETSLQALSLALQFVRRRIEHAIETGGQVRLADAPDGEPLDLATVRLFLGG